MDKRTAAKLAFHRELSCAFLTGGARVPIEVFDRALADGYAEIDRLIGDGEGREKREMPFGSYVDSVDADDDVLGRVFADISRHIRQNDDGTVTVTVKPEPFPAMPETSWTAGGARR